MKKLWEKYHLRNSEEYYFTPARMATMKERKKNSKCWWRVEKLEASYIASGKVNGATMTKPLAVAQKLHTVNLAISFLAIYSKELKRYVFYVKELVHEYFSRIFIYNSQ